jgi:hypothetical protein
MYGPPGILMENMVGIKIGNNYSQFKEKSFGKVLQSQQIVLFLYYN